MVDPAIQAADVVEIGTEDISDSIDDVSEDLEDVFPADVQVTVNNITFN